MVLQKEAADLSSRAGAEMQELMTELNRVHHLVASFQDQIREVGLLAWTGQSCDHRSPDRVPVCLQLPCPGAQLQQDSLVLVFQVAPSESLLSGGSNQPCVSLALLLWCVAVCLQQHVAGLTPRSCCGATADSQPAAGLKAQRATDDAAGFCLTDIISLACLETPDLLLSAPDLLLSAHQLATVHLPADGSVSKPASGDGPVYFTVFACLTV